MLKRNIAAILAALLAAGGAISLGSCTAPTGTNSETSTEESRTQTIEIETDGPRFDYFENDLSAYVTIDPSAYAAKVFVLPADLEVTAEDVDEYIRYTQYQNRTAVNGTAQVTDQPLAWGDDAYVYYRILVDGKAIASASYMDADEPTLLGLGSRNLTVLEEQLIGVIPSETSRENPAVFDITFPSDYGVSTLAGKAAVAEVYVAYSVRYTLPEVTEKFITVTLGYDQGSYLTFRSFVRDYLVAQNQSTVSTAKQTLIWDALIEAAEFTSLPEEEVTYYYNQRLANLMQAYETRATQFPTLDDFAPAYMGLAIGADWQAELREDVEKYVKKEMLGFAIAKMEGLDQVSDDDLQVAIDLWVNYYATQSNVPVTKEEVLANVGREALTHQAISYKVNDFLLERMSFMYGEE